jgi:UDP-N-acetylglucosamine pyrophosphorylase
MKNRIEQFEVEGKKVIYYDLSNFRNNAQFRELVAYGKELIQKYPVDNSLFSIINIEGVAFDTETKVIMAEWLDFDRPYIRQGALIGLDGIKRIMVNSILKMCSRDNIKFFPSRDEAVKWLAAL